MLDPLSHLSCMLDINSEFPVGSSYTKFIALTMQIKAYITFHFSLHLLGHSQPVTMTRTQQALLIYFL